MCALVTNTGKKIKAQEVTILQAFIALQQARAINDPLRAELCEASLNDALDRYIECNGCNK